MNQQRFIYQVRKNDTEHYIARMDLSANSALEMRKIGESEWFVVSPWDELSSKTVAISEWLGKNEIKNFLYNNGLPNSIP
jgi:hypothetical protein